MAGPSRTELEVMLKLAWMIPGMFGKNEARWLYRLSRRKGNLVEIGAWMGRTTAIMQMAAKPWEAHLTTVEPFGAEHMPPKWRDPEATQEKWLANLARIGLEPPELFAMTSDEALELYGEREIAMLFIDGSHSYRQVLRDLKGWGGLVKVGGYLALHDMFFPSVPGVCKAVTRWWDGAKWFYRGQVGWTIAFERRR